MASRAEVERSIDETTVSDRVIAEVAATKGADPLDLDPLYERIELDALNALYERGEQRQARSPDHIEFTYCGCEVVVARDGSVTVSATDAEES